MAERGRFVTFEGGEGAGKSTQMRLLADGLRSEGVAVTTTREPGGTELAERIRDLLLSGAAEPFGPEVEAVLFAAARADHVEKLIRPALARGAWVLCDRFTDSTRAYQGTLDEVDPAVIRALERLAVGHTRPDLTLILDLPVEIGLARATRRSPGGGDRFEREAVARHESRRQAFLAIAAAEPERCVVIDAEQGEAAVAEAIRRAVGEWLPHPEAAARTPA